ncbi:MAG: hypothetical protein WDO15_07610 [Bacteroidota bacterium]
MATPRRLALVLFFLTGTLIFSCSLRLDPERAALTHITEKKWSAAQSDLRKAFRKDTLNVEAKFLKGTFFLSDGNPEFNTDSAQLYANKALAAWRISTPKQRQKVDSSAILTLRWRVDSAAFENARQENTVEAYSYYINQYPLANDHSKAIELRDEVAYVEALRTNTPAAFKKIHRNLSEFTQGKRCR